MKIRHLVREEDLDRIAGQADMLAQQARKLKSLYRQQDDSGIVSTESVAEHERALSAAFMAVIRVTACYL